MAQQQLEELHLVTVQHFLRIMGGWGVGGGGENYVCQYTLHIIPTYVVSSTCHLAMSQASHEVTYIRLSSCNERHLLMGSLLVSSSYL